MEGAERQLTAILFSDVKSFSAMMAEDEERTIRLVKEHREIVRAILAKHHGEEHGTAGDSFFVLFASAVEAVQCAVEIQQSFHQRNAQRPPEEQIWIRIGIHVGDIVVDRADNHVYGDGINIAARTEPLAEPGGICITRDVYQQVHRKLEVRAVSIGRKEMNNILDAPELYQLVVGQVAGPPTPDRATGAKAGRGRSSLFMGVGACLLVLASLGAWLALKSTPTPEAAAPGTPTPEAATPDTLAAMTVTVIPFDNVTRSEELSWLGVGLSQGIADRLRDVGKLKVVDPPSAPAVEELSKRLSGDALSRELGRRAGARWVVTGSFAVAGQDVRVTAQVLLTEDGTVLRVGERQGKADAVLALQETLDTALLTDLLPGIEFKERDLSARASTKSDPAYRACARAAELFRRDGSPTPQNQRVLRDLLEEAIGHDPEYAAPHRLLASMLWFMGRSSVDIPLLREALAHADVVVRLSPDQAFPDAQRCRVRTSLGMYTEAIEDCERARELDPDVHYGPGLYEAVDQLDHEEGLVQDLVRREGANYWPWWYLGAFYVWQGRLEEARAPLAQAVRIHDESLAAGDESPVKRAGWLEPLGAHGLTGSMHLAAGELGAAASEYQTELNLLAGRTHVYKARWTAVCHGNLALIARLQEDGEQQARAEAALERDVAAGGAPLLAAVAGDLATYRKAAHRNTMLEQALVYAQRAVEMDGRHNPVHLELLADIHERLGHEDLALTVNTEGKALLPECETFDRRAKRIAAGETR